MSRSPWRRRREALSVNREKALKKLLSGSKNVRFTELTTVVNAFGFDLARVRGSHHLFEHPAIPEILNLQDCGGQAKPYQVKQYNLGMQESDA